MTNKCMGRMIVAACLVILPAFTIEAQVSLKNIASADPKKQSENNVRTVNDLKTGNWQNVISSFLQLSFTVPFVDKRPAKARLQSLKTIPGV